MPVDSVKIQNSDAGLDELLHYASIAGLSRARKIDTEEVIVRDEVIATGCAGCPEYGRNLMCPPFVPAPEVFRKKLQAYRYGLLVQLIVPFDSEQIRGNYEVTFTHAIRLHHIVCDLEERARSIGFNRALGFIGGCCRLCKTCSGPGQECRQPQRARSSMEANGISVVETCAGAGWPLDFPVRDRIAWTGLILLD